MDQKEKESFEVKKNRHYHTTFGGPSGEYVIQDLMRYCNSNNTSFDENPHVTSFNEGKRSALLYILSILQVNEVQLTAMQRLNNIYNSEFANSIEGEGIQEAFSKGLY
jgi:hypothetical protein